MSLLTVGVLKSPVGRQDKRLPIHPDHIAGIDPDLRAHLLLENGYGEAFGVPDDNLQPLVGGMLKRSELIEHTDVLLVVEPSPTDVASMRPGQVVCGWLGAHDDVVTHRATEQKLTVINCDAMNHWATDGSFVAPVFHLNNELAGYASVLHAMTLRGLTGQFGLHLTAVVLGLGTVAKGALSALQAVGIQDITVLTLANGSPRSSQLGGLVMEQMQRRDDDPMRTIVMEDGRAVCVAEFVGRYDVIVNCLTQDPLTPLEFVDNEEIAYFPAGRLIVDVTPVPGRGFEWARSTPEDDPMFEIGTGVTYYGGNSSHAFLWNSATWGMSHALLPYLPPVMQGPDGWESDWTLGRAICVLDGKLTSGRDES